MCVLFTERKKIYKIRKTLRINVLSWEYGFLRPLFLLLYKKNKKKQKKTERKQK